MKLIFTIVLFVFCVFDAKAKEIKLALTHIPKVLEFGNDNAPYNRFLKAFFEHSNLQPTLEFMPSSRANKLLNEKRIDCIFPIIPTNSRTISTQFSDPINGIRAHIFSLGPAVYTSLQQLRGKQVVYLRGYIFGDVIATEKSIGFFPVTSQQAALGMLKKQRADAYIDYVPDIRFVFNQADLKLLKYDPTAPVIKDFDRLECLNSPQGLEFLNSINRFLVVQKQQGHMTKLLGKYYVETN